MTGLQIVFSLSLLYGWVWWLKKMLIVGKIFSFKRYHNDFTINGLGYCPEISRMSLEIKQENI